jgi:hypothetical protein
LEEKFRLASELLVSKRREPVQTMLKCVEVRCTIFVKFHKP